MIMDRRGAGTIGRSMWAVALGSVALFMLGCGDASPITPDASGPSTTVDSGDAPIDAVDSGDANDQDGPDPAGDAASDAPDARDVGCSCSPFDSGSPISTADVALPCYCERSAWPVAFSGRPPCDTYDEVLDCSEARNRYIYVETYTNCSQVTVGYGVVNAVDLRVYDGATHALVGALRSDDYPSFICGSGDRVGMLRAGIVPGAECKTAKTEQPCRPTEDAGGLRDEEVAAAARALPGHRGQRVLDGHSR
jgi:hypothetical protein